MAEVATSTGVYEGLMHSVTALRGEHQRKMLLPMPEQLKYMPELGWWMEACAEWEENLSFPSTG